MKDIVTDVQILRNKSDIATLKEAESIIIELLDVFNGQNMLGLAAPQINIFKCIFIAKTTKGLFAIVNPELKYSPDKNTFVEGCLSLPGELRQVSRSKHVEVKAEQIKNLITNEIITTPMRFMDLDSAVIQHEFDHLNGVLIIDLPVSQTSQQKSLIRRRERAMKIKEKRIDKLEKKLSKINRVKI